MMARSDGPGAAPASRPVAGGDDGVSTPAEGAVLAAAILRRCDQLFAARQPWETHWAQVADHVLPRRAEIGGPPAVGDMRGRQLLDSTGIHANELLAAALHGMLTNPATRWFQLDIAGIDDDALADAARGWLAAAGDSLAEALEESNFATQAHELYLDLGCFGTGCLYLDETGGRLRFATRSLAEIAVAEDAFGAIDTVMRRFPFTARQAVQAFGAAALGAKLREAAAREPDRPFSFIHAVFPSADDVDGAPGGEGAAASRARYVSVYVCAEDRRVVSRGAYHEFPYMVPRWSKGTGEVYGRSPAMSALADMKALNEMCRTSLLSAQKAVDPPIMLPDDGFVGKIATSPGSINFYRAGAQDRIQSLPFAGDVRLGLEMEERRRQFIRAAFFVDQLRLAEGPQMTATEVLQRTEEKLRLMGPVLGRLQSELLRPLIARAFAILARLGRIAPPPAALRKAVGGRLRVDYTSPIARAQRADETQAIGRVTQMAQPFIAADPSLLDLIDAEKLIRHVAAREGLPRGLLRDERQLAGLRRRRAEEMTEAGAALSGATRPGGAPVEAPEGDPLLAMLRGGASAAPVGPARGGAS